MEANADHHPVARHLPALHRAGRALNGGRAQHVVDDDSGTHREISTSNGVEQGCPLGGFFFAVTTREPAEQVPEYARGLDPHAAFGMYLDDCYIVGMLFVIDRVLAHLQTSAAMRRHGQGAPSRQSCLKSRGSAIAKLFVF